MAAQARGVLEATESSSLIVFIFDQQCKTHDGEHKKSPVNEDIQKP